MVDKAYEAARNKLIPEAEAVANRRVREQGATHKEVKGKDGVIFKWSFFSQFFHEEMNRLAMSTGLVRG